MLRIHSIETFGTHEGPGIRLVIFTQGCNFRCLYCHNADTQEIKGGREISDDEIIDLLVRQEPYFASGGGLTISGGEPTLQAKELISLFKRAKQKGFHTALDTNGSIVNDDVKKLYDLTDLIILDVKHIDPKWHKKITGLPNKNTLEMAAYRQSTKKPMWLRYVLVPGYSDQKEFVLEWAKHFKDYTSVERVEILPYHTLGAYKYDELNRKNPLEGVKNPAAVQVEAVKKIFEPYFNNVVVQ